MYRGLDETSSIEIKVTKDVERTDGFGTGIEDGRPLGHEIGLMPKDELAPGFGDCRSLGGRSKTDGVTGTNALVPISRLFPFI